MTLKRRFDLMIIYIFFAYISLFFSSRDLWALDLSLDKESVFCIYHKVSGEDIQEQDIEDLSFELGRPNFTLYKPSEMFMRSSLKKTKTELMEKMKDYEDNSLFMCSLRCTLIPKKAGVKGYDTIFNETEMPQPTPYIGSRISKSGYRSITKILNSLAAKRLDLTKRKVLDITVYLRPEKIDYQFEKRNVAREKVILPIRCVIFQPIKIEVFDEIVTVKDGN